MWTGVLLLTTIICAIGWLKNHITALTLAYFMKKKGYTQPDDEEIRECTRWVVERLLKG